MAEALLQYAGNRQSTTANNTTTTTTRKRKKYANHHIPRFLELRDTEVCRRSASVLQVVRDGRRLTAQALRDEHNGLSLSFPVLVTDTAESIGMTVPKDCTVRMVAQHIGPAYPVSVIDVQHQEELEGWTLGDLVEYFEDEERLLYHTTSFAATETQPRRASQRRQRKSVQRRQEQRLHGGNDNDDEDDGHVTMTSTSPRVLNQISLEFSKTPLARVVKSPTVVRELDWIDWAWPSNQPLTKPRVQYYCLTSAQGCYTDYHVDFGGTSVWYHVVQGQKVFSLLPPTPTNLQIYEDWLCRSDQSQVFLPDLILQPQQQHDDNNNNNDDDKTAKEPVVLHVELQQGQTLLIPTGWIHAVYTPVDSLVLGGNFLHGLDAGIQLAVHGLETRTRVPGKFRFPSYLPLMVHVGRHHLHQLRLGLSDWSMREIRECQHLWDALHQWCRVGSDPGLVQTVQQHILKKKDGGGGGGEFDTVDDWLNAIVSERQRVLDANRILPNPHYKPPPTTTTTSTTSLRLQLPTSNNNNNNNKKETTSSSSSSSSSSPFRITLSSSAMYSAIPPINNNNNNNGSKKNRKREEFDGFAAKDGEDDEWKPSGGSSSSGKRRSSSSSSLATPKRRSTTAAPKPKKTVAKKRPSVSKPSTTSRQRLLKRMR